MIEQDREVSCETLHDLLLLITTRHAPHAPITYPRSFWIISNVLKDRGDLSLSILMHNHPSGDPTPSKPAVLCSTRHHKLSS